MTTPTMVGTIKSRQQKIPQQMYVFFDPLLCTVAGCVKVTPEEIVLFKLAASHRIGSK